MTDQPPKPTLPTRKTGLSPAQQKLQAALEKAAQKKSGAKPLAGNAGVSGPGLSARNSFTGKKTAFQRKAT